MFEPPRCIMLLCKNRLRTFKTYPDNNNRSDQSLPLIIQRTRDTSEEVCLS